MPVVKLLVLNGVNLGRLGAREPAVYGTATHDDVVSACNAAASAVGAQIEVRQSDQEAEYVGWLHGAAGDGDLTGVVLNPGAWTHTSVAIRDAAAMLRVPFVEVHLSNPLAREEFRHTSYTAGLACGIVAGFGIDSYPMAIRALTGGVSE